MYTCTYVHMYTCTHVHMYTCTHAHMYTCTHVHIYTCTHVHMYTCTAHTTVTVRTSYTVHYVHTNHWFTTDAPPRWDYKTLLSAIYAHAAAARIHTEYNYVSLNFPLPLSGALPPSTASLLYLVLRRRQRVLAFFDEAQCSSFCFLRFSINSAVGIVIWHILRDDLQNMFGRYFNCLMFTKCSINFCKISRIGIIKPINRPT